MLSWSVHIDYIYWSYIFCSCSHNIVADNCQLTNLQNILSIFFLKRNIMMLKITIIWILLFEFTQINTIHGNNQCRKIRPMKKVEYLTQSVESLKPVLHTMDEIDCGLQCLKVLNCHLFTFDHMDFTCHLLKSVKSTPNLDDSEMVYKVFWARGKKMSKKRSVIAWG